MKWLLIALLWAFPARAQLEVNQLIGFGAGGDITKSSATGEWSGATASYTFSGDDVVNTAGDRWIRTIDSFAGDFYVTFKIHFGSNVNTVFGFYPISADASFSQNDTSSASGYADISDETGAYIIKRGGGASDLSIRHADIEKDTDTFTAGDTLIFRRVGTAVTLEKNGSVITSFADASSGEVRLFGGGAVTSNLDIRDVSWTQ